MKKYINKLFEWLGYVPKCYKTSLIKRLAIESEILKCGVGYKMAEVGFEYKIFATTIKGELLIKTFPYRILDAESKDYARICAEELCDMLNEKY